MITRSGRTFFIALFLISFFIYSQVNGLSTKAYAVVNGNITSIQVDFESIHVVPQEFRSAIKIELARQQLQLPWDDLYYSTVFELSNDKNWSRVVLVPAYIVDNGWESVTDEDFIELILRRIAGNWQAEIYTNTDYPRLAQEVPIDFINFSNAINMQGKKGSTSSPGSQDVYDFPWLFMNEWKVTQTWHDYSNPPAGNAIDLVPVTGPMSVVAATSGLLQNYCEDSYGQLWLRTSNADGYTTYGHLTSRLLYFGIIKPNQW